MSSINALAVFAWPRGRLFPVASPLERFWRASFGVFCCSLFNRKGTTTSSDTKSAFARPKKRDDSNENAYFDHFFFVVPKQNAIRDRLVVVTTRAKRTRM